MPALQDVEKILNPADPSLAGLIPIGATVAGGLTNLAGTKAATRNEVAGTNQGISAVTNAGAAIPTITNNALQNQEALYNPYTSAGAGAVQALSNGIKPGGGLTDPFTFNYSQVSNDPAFQFELEQGQKQNHASLGAQGLGYSGGAARQLDQYNVGVTDKYLASDYSRAENTFRQNQQTRLQALQNLTGTGLSAANSESGAIGHNADQNVQGTEWTATQLSDLLQQRGDALAAGDMSKATAINDTLKSIAGQVGNNQVLAGLSKIFHPGSSDGPAAPDGSIYGPPSPSGNPISEVAGLAGTGLAGIGATTGGSLAGAGIASGEVGTALGGVEAGTFGAAAPAATAPVAGSGGVLGGIETAAKAMLHNPYTLLIGAGIIGMTTLLKSQAHWEANDMTSHIQKQFGDNLGKVVNGFDQALASGQLDKATAQHLRDQTAQTIQQFTQAVQDFGTKGKDKKKVAGQALQTMAKNFGANPDGSPSWSGILGKMDSEIQGLQ